MSESNLSNAFCILQLLIPFDSRCWKICVPHSRTSIYPLGKVCNKGQLEVGHDSDSIFFYIKNFFLIIPYGLCIIRAIISLNRCRCCWQWQTWQHQQIDVLFWLKRFVVFWNQLGSTVRIRWIDLLQKRTTSWCIVRRTSHIVHIKTGWILALEKFHQRVRCQGERRSTSSFVSEGNLLIRLSNSLRKIMTLNMNIVERIFSKSLFAQINYWFNHDINDIGVWFPEFDYSQRKRKIWSFQVSNFGPRTTSYTCWSCSHGKGEAVHYVHRLVLVSKRPMSVIAGADFFEFFLQLSAQTARFFGRFFFL